MEKVKKTLVRTARLVIAVAGSKSEEGLTFYDAREITRTGISDIVFAGWETTLEKHGLDLKFTRDKRKRGRYFTISNLTSIEVGLLNRFFYESEFRLLKKQLASLEKRLKKKEEKAASYVNKTVRNDGTTVRRAKRRKKTEPEQKQEEGVH